MDDNTKEGILAQLGTYEALYSLLMRRYEAGQDREVRLTPFTLLGRFRTDEFGQIMRLNRQIFSDDDRAAMPPVMTEEEFNRYFENKVQPRLKEPVYAIHEDLEGFVDGMVLAPPHVLCARCGQGWTYEACQNIESAGVLRLTDITEFAGKTLRDVYAELNHRSDGRRSFGHLAVYNDRWKAPSLDPDWEEVAPVRDRGWRDEDSEDVRITWDYVVQPGDQIEPFFYRYYHTACMSELEKESAAGDERDMLAGIKQQLEEAGFDDVVIAPQPLPERFQPMVAAEFGCDGEETVNQVLGGMPYYRVQTKQGVLGLFKAAYLMLDLHDAGLTIVDVYPDLADQVAQAPDYMRAVAGFTGDAEDLLRIWQLMVKRGGQA